MAKIRRQRDTKICSLCGNQIDVTWLERHQQKCRQRSPEQRVAARGDRDYGREQYRKGRELLLAAPPATPVKRKYANHLRNGKTRRLSATISVDFDTFRELIMQLAPSVNIDKLELV